MSDCRYVNSKYISLCGVSEVSVNNRVGEEGRMREKNVDVCE